MSAEDLARGLRAIDEEDVRQKVAAGDLSAAGDLELNDEEAGLLKGAADDYPEVAGFFFDVFYKPHGFEATSVGEKPLEGVSPCVRPGPAVRPGRGKDLLTGNMVHTGVWATLGSALRREAGAGGGPLIELVGGNRRPVEEVREGLGVAPFDALLHGGVLGSMPAPARSCAGSGCSVLPSSWWPHRMPTLGPTWCTSGPIPVCSSRPLCASHRGVSGPSTWAPAPDSWPPPSRGATAASSPPTSSGGRPKRLAAP